MSSLLRAFGFAAAALVLAGAGGVARGADALRVNVEWAGTRHPEAVRFEVSNATSGPITIVEDSLPWKNPARVLLLAKAPGMEPLRLVYLPHDVFRQPTVTLKAGETLVGVVDMTHHLRDVSLALAAGRLIVFWYYAPNDAAGNPLGEYGGWIGISTPTVATKPP